MSKSTYIVTAFYADAPGEEGDYGAGSASSTRRFQDVYWRCVIASHSSIRTTAPDIQNVLVTNSATFPEVDGRNTEEMLKTLKTTVVTRPFTFAPPMDFGRAWRATFYKFDALLFAAENLPDESIIILLDSDVVLTKPTDMIEQKLADFDVVAYRSSYGPDDKVNGLSRREITKLAQEIGSEVTDPVNYYGGEFLAMKGFTVKRVVSKLRETWELNLSRWRLSQPHFRTEEHILSYVFSLPEFNVDPGLGVIRRIWTTEGCYTSVDSDLELLLWHLPSEKHYGFHRLFAALSRQPDYLIPHGTASITSYMARQFRIPKRTMPQRAQRMTQAALIRFSKLTGRL